MADERTDHPYDKFRRYIYRSIRPSAHSGAVNDEFEDPVERSRRESLKRREDAKLRMVACLDQLGGVLHEAERYSVRSDGSRRPASINVDEMDMLHTLIGQLKDNLEVLHGGSIWYRYENVSHRPTLNSVSPLSRPRGGSIRTRPARMNTVLPPAFINDHQSISDLTEEIGGPDASTLF